jgi:hypothetical protein
MENNVFVVLKSKKNGAHCVVWESQWNFYQTHAPSVEYDFVKEFTDKHAAYKFSDEQNILSHIW